VIEFIKIKESWVTYIPKLIATLSSIIVLGLYIEENYRIGVDEQIDKCLPGYSVYLIDLKDKSVVKNGIFAFRAKNMAPFYDDGTKMVKIMAALPGDKVEINKNEQILINGVFVKSGLMHASSIGAKKEDLQGQGILGEGQYWFLGQSETSFDSRYWGAVSDDQIIGRAHPLF
tara:strand:+ start:1912 stop:2430 length:519 start_codon:yes stop_codon:yes gene_type:complete